MITQIDTDCPMIASHYPGQTTQITERPKHTVH